MITEYRTFLNPKKVYIPLTDVASKIANVKVEEGDRVLVGQIVAFKFNGKVKAPILSTVSGTVVGFEEKIDRYSKIVDHIVIENDMIPIDNYPPYGSFGGPGGGFYQRPCGGYGLLPLEECIHVRSEILHFRAIQQRAVVEGGTPGYCFHAPVFQEQWILLRGGRQGVSSYTGEQPSLQLG